MSTPNPSAGLQAGEPQRPATRDDANAFPQLSREQVERAKAYGEVERLPAGSVLFARGERSVDFFIMLSGSCEIYTDDGTPGGEKAIHTHRERGFTGELDLLSRRKILVSGRLCGCPERDADHGEVLRVGRDGFRRLMSGEPDVGDVVMRAFILRRLGLVDNAQGGVTLIGRRGSARGLELKRFLRRNSYPLRTLLYDDEPETADRLLAEHGFGKDDLPVVVCGPDHALAKPDLARVADCLGLTEEPDGERVYDVAVVGGGPGGMAAAVYAASEGLGTVVLEAEAPGGQAGTSSRIENYLGFPTGVSGWELAARAEHQAQKFGATLTVPRSAEKLERGDDGYRLHLDKGEVVRCRSVVLACGARWRRLNLDDAPRFEGRGLHYAATAVEGELCRGEEVIVVGGGNSAGQAAVYLSQRASRVHMLVRGDTLADSMSDYLLRRIEGSDRIDLRTDTEITGLAGDHGDRDDDDPDGWLERVTWTTDGQEPETRPVRHVFLMIGAEPNTGWLEGTLARDEGGFVLTGSGVPADEWPLERAPHAHESSLPGVFAVGDVRAGSVKRVASAVGEGSVCVADVHRVLGDV